MRPARYDASVLFDVTHAESITALARQLSIHRGQLYRYLYRGVTDQAADTLAVRLGHVPYGLWPEWMAGEGSETVVDVVALRRQLREQRRAEQAERRRVAKKAIAAATLPDRCCAQCEGRFTPVHVRQRFCRMACSEESRQHRKAV